MGGMKIGTSSKSGVKNASKTVMFSYLCVFRICSRILQVFAQVLHVFAQIVHGFAQFAQKRAKTAHTCAKFVQLRAKLAQKNVQNYAKTCKTCAKSAKITGLGGFVRRISAQNRRRTGSHATHLCAPLTPGGGCCLLRGATAST